MASREKIGMRTPHGTKIRLVHMHSHAVMDVKFHKRDGRSWFLIDWPLNGDHLKFRTTGYGAGPAKLWTIHLDDLRRLRDDPGYKPPKPPVRKPKPKRSRQVKVDPRQLLLFPNHEPTRAHAA